MTAKLEALSQPTAYTDREELESMQGPEGDSYAALWIIPHGCGEDMPLYAQEYVDYLIQCAALAEQREKEQSRTACDLLEEVKRLQQSNAELEQRLQQFRIVGHVDNEGGEYTENYGELTESVAIGEKLYSADTLPNLELLMRKVEE